MKTKTKVRKSISDLSFCARDSDLEDAVSKICDLFQGLLDVTEHFRSYRHTSTCCELGDFEAGLAHEGMNRHAAIPYWIFVFYSVGVIVKLVFFGFGFCAGDSAAEDFVSGIFACLLRL